jgi:hypothetical protein
VAPSRLTSQWHDCTLLINSKTQYLPPEKRSYPRRLGAANIRLKTIELSRSTFGLLCCFLLFRTKNTPYMFGTTRILTHLKTFSIFTSGSTPTMVRYNKCVTHLLYRVIRVIQPIAKYTVDLHLLYESDRIGDRTGSS